MGFVPAKALRALIAGVFVATASASAQPTGEVSRLEATVTLVAGQNAYLDAGAAAGLAAGDTVEVYRGDARAGALVVVSVADASAVVAFADEPFPLTRGARLTLVRPHVAGAGVPPAPAAPRADTAAAVVRPSILGQPTPPVGPQTRSTRATLDGRLQLGVDGMRTTTSLPGDLPDDTRSFATPFAALRLRADGIGAGLRLDMDARTSYRWAEGITFDQPSDTRVYLLSLSGRFAGVDARAGRFTIEHDPFTGAWDGVSLHLGDRNMGVGIAGGLQPDHGAGIPTTTFPKGSIYAHAEAALSGTTRGRVQALAGAIAPTAPGLTLRPFLGVRPQVWGRGFTLSGEVMADRDPDSTAGGWTFSRLSGRGSIEPMSGVRFHAFAMRRRGYLLFESTQLLLPASTRAGAGTSISLRGGPLPGTVFRADVSQSWAADLAPTTSLSGGLFLPRLPGLGLGINLDATAWTRNDPAGAGRGLTAGAAISRSLGTGFAQVGYRYGRSPLGLTDALVTQGLDATLQLPLTPRIALTLQAGFQGGDVLNSTRLYTALWYRL